jgi:hypothetical protein
MESENIINLYVFELEDELKFLYPTYLNDIDLIKLELNLQYDFIKDEDSLIIIDVIKINNLLDINKYVKQYMLYYGISNVIGGSYMNAQIPEYNLKSLENEFQLEQKVIDKHSLFISNLIIKYDKIKNINDLLIEKEKIIKELNFYNKTKEDYEKYKYFNSKDKEKVFNKTILYSLDWLYNYLTYTNFENKTISVETKNIYKELMPKLKGISKLFYELKPDYQGYSPIVNLYNPEFIFDKFVYHHNDIINWSDDVSEAITLYETLLYFYYKVANHIDELEFDLSTVPIHFNIGNDECNGAKRSKFFLEETNIELKYIENQIQSLLSTHLDN